MSYYWVAKERMSFYFLFFFGFGGSNRDLDLGGESGRLGEGGWVGKEE